MRLSPEQLAFLVRFAKTPDARYLAGILEARLAEQTKLLLRQVGEEVYRSQGRAIELGEILDQINGAAAQASLNRTGASLSQANRT